MAQTPAKIQKHPVHPMLVVIPLGLWTAALVFDIVHAATGDALWRTLAFWNIGLGVVGALLAAVPGFVDWLSMQGRARRIGTYHMLLNLGAVALFAVNFLLRSGWGARFVASDSSIPLVLTIVGVVGVFISGWLGGEMVYVERVGVMEREDTREDRVRRIA